MTSQQEQINQFIDSLSKHRPKSGYFNPYQGEAQQNNLREYLLLMIKRSPKPVLIVGEAPGYKGCRLTGIPFSSSDFIQHPPHPFWEELNPGLTVSDSIKENTATMVWRFMNDVEALPLFWNAFPFHPYRHYQPRSNRAPNEREMRVGLAYLRKLSEIFDVSDIIGLGRRGQLQVSRCFPDRPSLYVRHPSFGGKAEFESRMSEFFIARKLKLNK